MVNSQGLSEIHFCKYLAFFVFRIQKCYEIKLLFDGERGGTEGLAVIGALKKLTPQCKAKGHPYI